MIVSDLGTAPAKALVLMGNNNYSDQNLPELYKNTIVNQWVKDLSFETAKSKAYLNGDINGISDLPSHLPANYYDDARNATDKLIVLAGKRIAAKLANAL